MEMVVVAIEDDKADTDENTAVVDEQLVKTTY